VASGGGGQAQPSAREQAAHRTRGVIVFTRVFPRGPRFRLYLVGADGRGTRQLRTGMNISWEPRWSPDGRWIAFRGGAGDDLYVIRPNGTGLRQLTHDRAHEQSPAWSPDQAKIAFARFSTPAGPSSVWALTLKTGVATRLTPDALNAASPSWSADGSQIAFVSQTARHGYTPELWLMRADGSHARHIFPSLDGDSEPVWAPHGYRMLVGDQTTLYVMDARRGHPRPIVRLSMTAGGETEAAFPQWSPDGTKIVFDQLTAGGRSQIWVVDADGRRLHRLTAPPKGASDSEPSWQP
jgi:TolB protein